MSYFPTQPVNYTHEDSIRKEIEFIRIDMSVLRNGPIQHGRVYNQKMKELKLKLEKLNKSLIS